jgi:hypothetical protein
MKYYKKGYEETLFSDEINMLYLIFRMLNIAMHVTFASVRY